jgi:hypothetical protein
MRVERGVCPRACADGRFGTVAVVCTPGGEGVRTVWCAGVAAGQAGVGLEIERARLLAERLHADDFEEDGSALLEHVRRVVCRVEADVQVVAWLHEVLEWTVVAEHELLGGASTATNCARCGSCIARTTRARAASTSRTWA